MNPICDDFENDVEMVARLVLLVEALTKSPAVDDTATIMLNEQVNDDLQKIACSATSSRTAIPILYGVLLLYLSGRFENFVKELFEDTCDTLAGKCKKYEKLPKKLQENLIRYTAEVVADPRKYGHGPGGVKSFIETLASNLRGDDLSAINSQCVSITSANMRPSVLSDLFLRIGIDTIWETISQQTAVKVFFQDTSPQSVVRKCKDKLDEIMLLRNKIAHPSGVITWPSSSDLQHYSEYMLVVARSIAEHCTLYATIQSVPPNT